MIECGRGENESENTCDKLSVVKFLSIFGRRGRKPKLKCTQGSAD